MNNPNEMREINNIERGMISTSLSLLTKDFNKFLEENDYISLISLDIKLNIEKHNYPLIFIVKRELFELYRNKIKRKKLVKIISLGLYFGFIKKGRFFLSLEGAQLLIKAGYCNLNKVLIINENGEKAISYGNNLLKKEVESISEGIQKGEIILLMNRNKELISIARIKINSNDLEKSNENRVIARNLVDKGYYVRIKQ